MTKSSTPALWAVSTSLVSTLKPKERVSAGNRLDGTVSWTVCFLSRSAAKPRLVPCWTVCRSQVMPDSTPLRVTLVLVESISPKSMEMPMISTKNLSVGVQSSIWYRANSMVTLSATMGSGPALRGMLRVLDISSLPVPSRPRNWEKPGASAVDPDVHAAATVGPDPSKSSSSRTTSGTHDTVGAGVAMVGAAEGLPGVTVGTPVVGDNVLGLALGEPGVTVGLEVVGTPVVGATLVG